MKIGKIPESILKRAILKQRKTKRPEVIVGPGIGEDNCSIRLEDGEITVLSTNPAVGDIQTISRYGLYGVMNNLVTSKAEPVGILTNILLPYKTNESQLRTIMKSLEKECESLGLDILGGHTELTKAVNEPVLTVTGVGRVEEGSMLKTNGMKPDQEIIMTKWIGISGTAQIAAMKEKELQERYSRDFIMGAQNMIQHISIIEEAALMRDCNVSMMHDLSKGGIFGGLWEAAAASGVGLEIDLNKIPMRQETVEICEFFDLNPFLLMANGSLLIAADRGSDIVNVLEQAGIPAAVIGKATAGNERIVFNEDERRFLEPPKNDELVKLL